MVCLLLDEGLPFRAAASLRDRGIDAVHAREVNLISAPDTALLTFAEQQGRICVTLDRDFHRLLAASAAARPSVILIRAEKLGHLEAVEFIARLVDQLAGQLETGVAVTATRRGVRLRRLPLK